MPYQRGEGKTVVIALGGNALGNTPQEQLELVKDTAAHIVDMVEDGVNVVVSHGNGPQVGMINNAFDYASTHDGKTPAMPFPECGAMSQGYIGYQLSQAILNDMKRRGIMRSTACVVTQTVVYPEDPAFQNPTKPVGAFLTEEEAMKRAEETGYTYKEDAGRGWRQVVASPKPQRIVEFDAIKDLMDDGYIVISTGGGGVPVIEKDDSYHGVPAVIDKDRSSAKLAADFKADMLVILTAVEKVCINFNTPEQQELNSMTVAEAQKYIEEGQFAPGSMLPKVEACIEFVQQHPEGKALITSLECAADGLKGKTGTVITA
ncbi:carbamate kinase [Gordonibacter pamelaeae]